MRLISRGSLRKSLKLFAVVRRLVVVVVVIVVGVALAVLEVVIDFDVCLRRVLGSLGFRIVEDIRNIGDFVVVLKYIRFCCNMQELGNDVLGQPGICIHRVIRHIRFTLRRMLKFSSVEKIDRISKG
jgi:hypothetical protein